MNDNTTKRPLAPWAMELAERGAAVKSAPILSKFTQSMALADDVAALLVEIAARLDNLTPYIDETHEWRGDNLLKNVREAVADDPGQGGAA